MRPSGVTAVASTITIPAPPTARLPKWTICQSFGMPSSAETEYAVLADGLPGTFLEFPGESLASLTGGPTWLPAAPVVWDASGVARVTLVGGFVNGIPSALTWSQ